MHAFCLPTTIPSLLNVEISRVAVAVVVDDHCSLERHLLLGLALAQSSLVKPSLACPFPTLPLPLSLLLTSPQLGLAGLMHGGVYSCASGWQVRLAPPAEDLQRSPSRSQPANQSLGHCGGCCFDTYVQMHERRFLT